jgi:hypothetical protein
MYALAIQNNECVTVSGNPNLCIVGWSIIAPGTPTPPAPTLHSQPLRPAKVGIKSVGLRDPRHRRPIDERLFRDSPLLLQREVSTLSWDRLCVSVHHSSKWTLIIRVPFASMRADYIPVQTATGERLHLSPPLGFERLTSAAIGEVLNHVCDVVI